MLSDNPRNLLPGRHQRQNSTPTKFDAPKVAFSPAIHPHHEPHRRGLSLDQTDLTQKSRYSTKQEESMQSGEEFLQQQLCQHNLREAQQQQHQMARPGQEQRQDVHEVDKKHIASRQERDDRPYTNEHLTTVLTTPNQNSNSRLYNTYNTNDTDMFQSFDPTASAGYLEGFGNGMDGNVENFQLNQGLTVTDMPHSMPSHIQAQESSRRPLSSEGLKRPQTPVYQTYTNCFPMTPAATPFSQKASYSRTADSSPTREDPNATIKASQAMERGTSCQDNFATMRQHAMSPDIPSPPNTAPLRPRGSIDLAAFPQPNFLSMSDMKIDIPLGDGGYNANYSPVSNAVSSTMSSFQSSPEITHMSLFADLPVGPSGTSMASKYIKLPASQSAVELGNQCSFSTQDAVPRSQSLSELDPDEFVEDTGISCDDIASFIYGPDPVDGKWKCMYEGCGKMFGRKENIKSHVQTHLGDRQFRCKHCEKRFVRQHDLKRHANIHTGVKLYTCACRKDFARHDALTRHRQRGCCEGAMPGTPKKVTKRGRPKKTRPDTEERLEKSARTRQRVLEKISAKTTSSISGSSESHPSSPQFFDTLSMSASSSSHGQQASQQVPDLMSAQFLAYTPPPSPGHSTGNSLSSQHSQHSYTPKAISMSPTLNIKVIAEGATKPMTSQSGSRKGSIGFYSTPPELDLTSSSPTTSTFFDFDGSSTSNTSAPMSFEANSDFVAKDSVNQDFDLFAELGQDNGSGKSIYGSFFDTALGSSSQQKEFEEALKSGNALMPTNHWVDDLMENTDPFFDI